ncbi:MAG: hypothetical protein CMD02_06650 [Flavobacteriales bacterium]|nr:hypothetical protein [Flavobacteriales bacterium]
MFFIFSKILSFLIKPTFWILLLIISAIFFKKQRKTILFLSVFSYWFFSNSFIIDQAYNMWEDTPKSISEITQNYDYGIVLGGFSGYDKHKNRVEFNDCGDRLFYSIQLFKSGKIKNILISGGNGQLLNNGYMESEWARDFLIHCGIPDENILIENKSRNTWENALYTSDLLQQAKNKKLLLITSSWHMKRAKFCFNKNNMNVDLFTTDYTKKDIKLNIEYLLFPNSTSFVRWETLIKEFVGNIVYKIKF